MKITNIWRALSDGQKAAWIGVLGLVIAALVTVFFAFVLPKMFPDKNSPPSVSYNSSNNNGDTVQGTGNVLDKSTKNYYADTNKPSFRLYINGFKTEVTNGSTIRLPKSREITLRVKNTENVTATHLTVEFLAWAQSSNFVTANGWNLQPPIVEESWYKTKTNYHSYSAHWLIEWDKPVPIGTYNQMPPIFVSTNVWVPTNYQLPALTTHIIIFADGAKLQEFVVWFLFAEQPERRPS